MSNEVVDPGSDQLPATTVHGSSLRHDPPHPVMPDPERRWHRSLPSRARSRTSAEGRTRERRAAVRARLELLRLSSATRLISESSGFASSLSPSPQPQAETQTRGDPGNRDPGPE